MISSPGSNLEALENANSKAIAVMETPSTAVSGYTSIVPYGHQSLAQRDQELERRRNARNEHYHDQVWTKDPHGGPYRKVQLRPDAHVAVIIPEACS